MNLVLLSPGAGEMLCGNCLHDNALVAALRRLGHDVLMVPLYLPIRLDEPDQCAGMPIFFGGVNVYLEQKSALFRHSPRWLHRLLDAPMLLRWAAHQDMSPLSSATSRTMLSPSPQPQLKRQPRHPTLRWLIRTHLRRRPTQRLKWLRTRQSP